MYNAIRVFIAGYVWMTGFGNFSYYYKTGNFSVGRYGAPFIRAQSQCISHTLRVSDLGVGIEGFSCS